MDTGTHGRRSSGVARSASSLTTPTGLPAVVTVTMPPASASRARRTASASGRSPGTASVRRARSRATSAGSLRRTRAEVIAAEAPDQRNAATTNDRMKSSTSGGVSRSVSCHNGQLSASTATTRPPHPAARVPVWGRPVAPHTAAFSTRPPSSGRPGTRLSTPISRLAPARPSTAIRSSPSGVTNQRPSAAAPTAIDVSGPTTAIQNSCRGLRVSPLIAVMPPRKCSVIASTWNP